jgi:hypothetical protein
MHESERQGKNAQQSDEHIEKLAREYRRLRTVDSAV